MRRVEQGEAVRIFDLLTGITWVRLVNRRFSLLELLASLATFASTLMLLFIAWFWSANDGWSPRFSR